jgi:hypothetical protein
MSSPFVNPLRWKVIGTYRTCQLPYAPLPPLPKKLNRTQGKASAPCQLSPSTLTVPTSSMP